MVIALVRYSCGHSNMKFSMFQREIRHRRPCETCKGRTGQTEQQQQQQQQQQKQPPRRPVTRSKKSRKNHDKPEEKDLPANPEGEVVTSTKQNEGSTNSGKREQSSTTTGSSTTSSSKNNAAAQANRVQEILRDALEQDKDQAQESIKDGTSRALIPVKHDTTSTTNSNQCTSCPPAPPLWDFVPSGMSLVPPHQSLWGRSRFDEYTEVMTAATIAHNYADRYRHLPGCVFYVYAENAQPGGPTQ